MAYINRQILIFISIALSIIVLSLVFYTLKSKLEIADVKEAYRLNALAEEWKGKDPTIAMRIEEIAMQKSPDSMIVSAAHQIYEGNAFYKIISKYDGSFESATLSPGTRFITGTNSVASLSPDGTKIITGSISGASLLSIDGTVLKEFRINRNGPDTWIRSVAFSRDGTKILCGSDDDDTVRLWSIDSTLLNKFKVDNGEPRAGRLMSVAFSPDGKEVLTGSEFAARLWNINGTLLREIRYGEFMFENIWSVCFSPDGTKILTSSRKGMKLWSKEGKLLSEFKVNTGEIHSVAFSSDGTKIVAGCWDGTVNLYMIREGIEKKFIVYTKEEVGNTGGIRFVAFSPDDTKVLTSSHLGAKLFSVEGTLLKEFKRFTKELGDVVGSGFSPDGSRIFIGYTDATTLWSIEHTPLKEFKSLEKFLHSGLIEPLTVEQKQEFGIK